MESLKIGVLLGGNSSERKISLRSGRAVITALRSEGFRTVRLDPQDPSSLNGRLTQVDVAFIALHGKGGEDGSIQYLLEKKKIPYVGSDVQGSRRAFDKAIAKRLFKSAGIPTADYEIINASDWRRKLKEFPLPAFAKPLCDGSSIGVFAIENAAEASGRIVEALAEYGELLIEKKIEGREFTVGILGRKALPVVEMKPNSEFYDYRAKYTKGMTQYLVPAPIKPALAKKLQKIALRVHETLGLRDFSRVDIMVDVDGNPFVLEANSIPGFTELSLLPKAAGAAGISFGKLCRDLVERAIKRNA